MARRIRGVAAALAAAALLVGTAVPAHAGSKLDNIDRNSVPPVFDLVVMRPIGLATTVAGAAIFLPVGLVTALFHRDSVKPVFNHLVRGPYEFTFQDPIGSHPGDERNYY
jgi:hypothetical protein